PRAWSSRLEPSCISCRATPCAQEGPKVTAAKGFPHSILGEPRERSLHTLVPTHRCLRVTPAALHRLQRFLVVGVAGGNHLFEVLVLGLDYVVGALAVMCVVARSAELPAGHGLHFWSPIWFDS